VLTLMSPAHRAEGRERCPVLVPRLPHRQRLGPLRPCAVRPRSTCRLPRPFEQDRRRPPPGLRPGQRGLASLVLSPGAARVPALSLPAHIAVKAFCGDKSLADAIGACGPKKCSRRSPPSGTPPLLADKPTRALDGEAEMAIDEPKRPTGTGSLALCHLTVMASL
jgi:hypothetical protein